MLHAAGRRTGHGAHNSCTSAGVSVLRHSQRGDAHAWGHQRQRALEPQSGLTVCNAAAAPPAPAAPPARPQPQTSAGSRELYPVIKPFNCGMLKVSQKHTIAFWEYGNPHGVPVLSVHGGPGAASFENHAYAPAWRIVLQGTLHMCWTVCLHDCRPAWHRLCTHRHTGAAVKVIRVHRLWCMHLFTWKRDSKVLQALL
jgi:hypothetical protein